jgi:plasmid stability protein
MTVTLSVKNVPEHIARALRERAARNHRSLQGEVLSILHDAVAATPRRTRQEILAQIQASGLSTSADSVKMIRADRDGR